MNKRISAYMKYAREHIKRYWAFSYRRAIGVSMLTFSIALAIGMSFTAIMSGFFYNNYAAEFLFWMLLILITVVVLITSLVNAHISIVRFMKETEHSAHSRNTGIWLSIITVGTLAFFIPILFFNTYMEPLVFLFSFGGILWVFYLSVAVIFRHHYNEIAFSALALWIIFAVGIVSLYSTFGAAPLNPQQMATAARFSLFISVVSLVTIFGITGVSLLFNSSRAFVSEFKYLMQIMEMQKPKKKKRKH